MAVIMNYNYHIPLGKARVSLVYISDKVCYAAML